MTQKTYIAIILDRSGSMSGCRKATIEGFNKQVSAIRQEAEKGGMETFVSFYTFNHNVEPQYKNLSVNFLEDLTEDKYVTKGDTAMYDAVGDAVNDLLENTEPENPNNAYLVFIVSDGFERCSKRFTRKALAEIIKQCQDTGRWTFTYMGANQDLSKVANDLNIPKGNVAAYASTIRGMSANWSAQHSNTTKYFADRRVGKMSKFDFQNEGKVDTIANIKDDEVNADRPKAIWTKDKVGGG